MIIPISAHNNQPPILPVHHFPNLIARFPTQFPTFLTLKQAFPHSIHHHSPPFRQINTQIHHFQTLIAHFPPRFHEFHKAFHRSHLHFTANQHLISTFPICQNRQTLTRNGKIHVKKQAKTILKIALPTFKNDENHTQNSKILCGNGKMVV